MAPAFGRGETIRTMKNNGNKPIEEELRSSQLYKTLTGSGIPVADKIAQGLGKAAEGIDTALNGFSPTVKRGAGQNGYYRNYTQGSAPQPQGRRTAQSGPTQQTRGAAGQPQPSQPYSYSYTYTYPSAPKPQSRQQPNGNAGAAQPHPGQRPMGVNPAPAPQMPQMKQVRKGSPAKFYITGAAALAYALAFPLYEPSHFIIFGLVLAGVFLLSSKLFRGKKQFVPIEPEKPKKQEKAKPEQKPKPEDQPSKTGNPEVDKLIDEGNESLKKLRAANEAIPDESLSQCIDRMERASADIFRYIADHPEKAPQIRKFMNYYLPTTLKLLNSYQRLSSQSVKGENITSTLFNIAGMMHTVADAFEKQLDALFTDEAMDISADITVFESMLQQEGFVEESKKATYDAQP